MSMLRNPVEVLILNGLVKVMVLGVPVEQPEEVEGTLEEVLKGLERMLEALKELLGKVLRDVTEVEDMLEKLLEEELETLESAYDRLLDGLLEGLEKLLNELVIEVLRGLEGLLDELVIDVLRGLEGLLDELVIEVLKGLERLLDRLLLIGLLNELVIEGLLDGLLGGLFEEVEAVGRLKESLKKLFGGTLEDVLEEVGGLSKVTAVLVGLDSITVPKEPGGPLITAMLEGLEDVVRALILEEVKSIADEVLKRVEGKNEAVRALVLEGVACEGDVGIPVEPPNWIVVLDNVLLLMSKPNDENIELELEAKA